MNPTDPTDLRALEADRADKATRQRLAIEAEKVDVVWVMSSKRGRSMMWRLLEQAGVFQLSFDQNALRMAFNEGNRNFGNRVLDTINRMCPEQYAVMLRESIDASSRRDGNGNNQ